MLGLNTSLTATALVLAAAVAPTASGASTLPSFYVKQSPIDYFLPPNTNVTASPYYRDEMGNWSWTHDVVPAFTTPYLLISAYNVDFNGDALLSGARHEISVDNNLGVKTSLGFLGQGLWAWAYTKFTLDPGFYPSVANGLRVYIDIDTTAQGYSVTLGKSVLVALETDDPLPPPEPVALISPPAAVPLPAAGWLLVAGLAGLAAAARRRPAI